MSRGPVSWKESDAKRAIKIARDSGLPIARLEIKPSGEIAIVIGKPEEAQPCRNKSAEEGDPWANVKLGQN
jgi:hypothetical protein